MTILLRVTGDQLKILKANAKEEGYAINYSTFAILVGLIWKCASMARELPNDQETKLTFSANGRSRLQPPLPLGYFGNVIFQNRTVALAGDLQSKPLWYAVNLIHETLARLDNDYLRSVIDFLKLHPNTKRNRLDETRSPNLGITSWSKFPTRDADFGWGQPFHVGFCGIVSNEGRVWITDDVAKEGNLSVLIALQPEHVEGSAEHLLKIKAKEGVARGGDLQSKPLWYAASCILETLMRLDDDYSRSFIDFLKLHPNTRRNRLDECRSPNFGK
ncbi:Transferase [Parasponia andersonii]|uniref:Transferase n=1 Tax=Parasponia andersonii TaxID=3476 RepID=A0A2P5DWW1_PARAD|nr:Transferase [Parasponia andersonii]